VTGLLFGPPCKCYVYIFTVMGWPRSWTDHETWQRPTLRLRRSELCTQYECEDSNSQWYCTV